MSHHEITWEDAGMAGVRCDGHDVDAISAEEEDPWTCGRCGAAFRLRWNVWLEEVTQDEPAPDLDEGGET